MSEQKEKFAKVPIEALNDKRLSPTEFKVLVTLLSFVTSSPLVWPKRKTISQRCGIAMPHISRATAALVRYGWLEKVGNGGRSSGCQYAIKHPITRTESVQVNGKTRTDSVQRPRTESVQRPRTDSVQRKEETNEETIEETNARTARVPAWVSNALRTKLPEWIKPSTWQAFVEHRRELGAKLTTQGIQGTLDQLDRMRQAGQQPTKVIEQSILKGWTGLFDLSTTTRTHTRTRSAPSDVNNLIAQGERIGIYPNAGESAQDFAARIQRESARRVH